MASGSPAFCQRLVISDLGFIIYLFPGHALHEKNLQRQKGGGPLVGSQEQRALLVPVIVRLQTAYKPLVNR